jgi:hypothetical protein
MEGDHCARSGEWIVTSPMRGRLPRAFPKWPGSVGRDYEPARFLCSCAIALRDALNFLPYRTTIRSVFHPPAIMIEAVGKLCSIRSCAPPTSEQDRPIQECEGTYFEGKDAVDTFAAELLKQLAAEAAAATPDGSGSQ